MKHYTDPYLLNPQHKITIDLIGMGGTGSQVLNNLGRMNYALMGLGHPGIHLRAWDPDMVSESNMGRQLFSPSDLHQNKAAVLVTRVNRFFGTEWEGHPAKYPASSYANITITCVDTVGARIMVADQMAKEKTNAHPYERRMYWLDFGNTQYTGQVVLGTVARISQPKGSKGKATLKTVMKMFPQIRGIKQEDQGPSCSLAEALHKQDMFINSILAQFGSNLLWKMIREGGISYQGCYLNLETLTVNPIKI